MDWILIILGISGSAAIVGATYVFTVSARNYNSKGFLVIIAEIVISLWRLFLSLRPVAFAAAAIMALDELGGFL